MGTGIRYVHTNIIAKDWRKLAQFYMDVFQCTPTYPERKLQGKWLEDLTGIPNVDIKGIHLALPGYGYGPTLEIFEYVPGHETEEKPKINGQGLAHLAFHVESVETILKSLLEYGGEQLGKIVVQDYGGIGVLTVVYARDPEGNLIEIQNWKK
ncbi:MAG: glyoxalase [Firmicutes bacterium]|nr:glyoxalase [Bacillota bacterium]